MPVWVHVIRFSFFVFKLRNEWPFGYTHSSFIRNNAVFLWNHNFVRKVAFVWERRFNNSPKVLWFFFFFWYATWLPRPTLDHYQGNGPIHPVLITAFISKFYCVIFCGIQTVSRRVIFLTDISPKTFLRWTVPQTDNSPNRLAVPIIAHFISGIQKWLIWTK